VWEPSPILRQALESKIPLLSIASSQRLRTCVLSETWTLVEDDYFCTCESGRKWKLNTGISIVSDVCTPINIPLTCSAVRYKVSSACESWIKATYFNTFQVSEHQQSESIRTQSDVPYFLIRSLSSLCLSSFKGEGASTNYYGLLNLNMVVRPTTPTNWLVLYLRELEDGYVLLLHSNKVGWDLKR